MSCLYEYKGEVITTSVVDDLVATAKEFGLKTSLEAVEKVILLRLLEEQPDRAQLAWALGISRPTLYRLIRKHGLLGNEEINDETTEE